MTREEFRIVQKHYTTSSLIMIFYNQTIIESVEIYKNYGFVEDEADKAAKKAEYDKAVAAGKKPKEIKVKPVSKKSTKVKRTESEITAECENKIKRFMQAYSMLIS
jgi:hypothetical protein